MIRTDGKQTISNPPNEGSVHDATWDGIEEKLAEGIADTPPGRIAEHSHMHYSDPDYPSPIDHDTEDHHNTEDLETRWNEWTDPKFNTVGEDKGEVEGEHRHGDFIVPKGH